MHRPTRFQIVGLYGSKNVDLPIKGDALILVGPNGAGKSTVANVFYFFVTRQWRRLLEYPFEEIAVWFGKEEIRAKRADISGLSGYSRLFKEVNSGSRIGLHLKKIEDAGLVEEFFSSPRLSLSIRSRFSKILDISSDEVRAFHSFVWRRAGTEEDGLFSAPRVNLERVLSEHLPSRTLYLPTYRRIEKDLRDIIPDFESRYRPAHDALAGIEASSAKHYVDLVNFGMEDVRANISTKTQELRDYSLKQFNELSGIYLGDVIRGKANEYSPSQLNKLTEDGLGDILARVSDTVLSPEDKSLLREKITKIKGKRLSEVEQADRYLAHYFSRLMSVSADLSSKEEDVTNFINVCNRYLFPSKEMVYDEKKFSIYISDARGKNLDLSVLSSGEKQVISIFSHLYLDDAKDQVVIIDEPELSLSVPWQKQLLPDILDSGHCGFILSVTHSPFIYQNRLESRAVDLRRKTTFTEL